MTPTLRLATLLGVLCLILAGLAAWSFADMAEKKHVTHDAAADLAEVKKLAERIIEVRDQPAIAGSYELELDELTRQIEEAADKAELPGGSLVRIWPEAARRVGDSPYKEKPTQILLRQVTLRQITIFLHELSNSESGLNVQSLRVVAPHRDVEDDTWTAEATITYLIYSPNTETSRRNAR